VGKSELMYKECDPVALKMTALEDKKGVKV
jgi:hypothetical protein